MYRRHGITALIAIVLASTSLVYAAEVDWKLYGGTSVAPAGNTYCFYDDRGIVREASGLARVWTKCLLQKDLDADHANAPYNRAFMDMAASRIGHYYLPPMMKIERMDGTQVVTAIMYETLADVSDLNPQAQIFYELDCQKRKMRELDIMIGGQSKNTPSDWRDVPPEGNGANLLALVCQA